jgi:RHS repeat-associated protein
LVVGFTYTYDRMDNKLTEGKLHDLPDSETYSYDSANRLIGFHRGTGGAVPDQTTWSLDGVGNWTSVNGQSQSYSSFNELLQEGTGQGSSTLSYDDSGNQIDDGTYQYSYDAFHRVRMVTRKSDGAVIAVYSYDAEGRRIRKVVTNSGALNGTTDFYLDDWQDLEEHNAANTPTQEYVYGRDLQEVLETDLKPAGRRLFYSQNALGSVFALTDTSGKVAEGYQYDAYGKQTVYDPGSSGVVTFAAGDVITVGGVSAVGNAYLFTGQRLDAETGTYYDRMRYYSVEQGRFLSRDPLTFVDPTNLYQYALDNPSDRDDPLGEAPELTASTVKGPIPGKCGDFAWYIDWSLTKPSAMGGWIIQHIQATFTAQTCKGKEITLHAPWDYWEAWGVPKKETRPNEQKVVGFDDQYLWTIPFPCTKRGQISIKGTATFYEGLLLPLAPLIPKGFFRPNLATGAGSLLATTFNLNLGAGSNTVEHNLLATWNCCPPWKKTSLDTFLTGE